VDKEPQPRYCGDEFHQADALEWLDAMLPTSGALRELAAIHASPPCQRWSSITGVTGRPEDHPDLITPTRELLCETGLPYVIENVPMARRELRDPISLCGVALCPSIVKGGQRFVLRRHRLFETSFPILVPPCACSRLAGTVLGVYGGGTRQDTRAEANPGGGNTRKANLAQGQALMQMPWANRKELTQAIPPAYTELIGHQLMQHIEAQLKGAA
jgi:DNA (cytosine-5)-methyltransferase 1